MRLEHEMNVDDQRDGRDFGPRTGTRPRGSHWLTGLLLLVAVAGLLGGAVALNQRFRPQVGLQPLAMAQAQAAPGYRFILTGPLTTVSRRDSMPVVVPSPEPTSDRIDINVSLLKEIEGAYSRFWDVRTEAAANVDPSRLPEVAAGPALEREQAEIAELAARGVAAVVDVDHEVGLVSLSQDQAELYDEYVNRSYLVDPSTREPVGAPEPEQLVKVSYRLQKVDGTWKVVDSERHD